MKHHLIKLALFCTLLLTLMLSSQAAAPAQAQTGTIDFIGQIGGATNVVFVQGNYAYIGVGPRLVILDITNPAQPTKVGESPVFSEFVEEIYVSDSYAYLANSFNGLQVLDVSNPATPTLIGSYNTPGIARGVAVRGNYVYVADGHYGLQVINISNPAVPTMVGSYDTPGSADGVAVSGNFAYVADWDKGLQVIDVSNPASLTLVGSYNTLSEAQSVV